MNRAHRWKVPDLLALFVLALLVSLIALAFCGCAAVPGTASYRRQTAVIDAIGKANKGVQTYVLPSVPPPYQQLLEGAGIATTAALGLWMKRLHSKVNSVSRNTHAPPSPPGA